MFSVSILAVILVLMFILSFIGTRGFINWSLSRKSFLDIPNERSSHTEPVPRGGGVVFVAICLTSILICGLALELKFLRYFSIGGIVVVAIGWLDDLLSLPVWLRFSTHLATAFMVIYLFGYWDFLYIPLLGEVYVGEPGAVLTVLWIAWIINAFNFIDGIDGLASMLAIMAGLGWLAVGFISGNETLVFLSSVIIVCVLGFLVHNWPPAKVFMGDVGSTFLGYCFAVIPLMVSELALNLSEDFRLKTGGFWFTFAVFCLFPLIFDTVFTLIRRAIRREKVWKAHRSHLYQRLVGGGLSHREVTTLYSVLSFLTTGSAVSVVSLKVYELIPVVLCFFSAFFLIIAVDRIERAEVK
jgi:UDP-N-acetylmuramyl pentapeptide phosphotransferase/UDP-N-acetylglucosamine-1-phosphate transferase